MTTGTTAPRYAFERELGQGGFGSVVLATDSLLGRRVALKSLRGGDSRALASEARVLAGLRHPNIVQAYDFTRIDGEPYLVLEFVDGRSLRELLEAGPPEPDEAVRYTLAIAGALAYAHGQGVIHNDVKPENVLIAANREALLTDFGVASSPLAATLLPGEADSIAGSLPYIAPEVIQGVPPGPQSDLYALAATLYEMLSGAPPFAGVGAAGMAQRLAGPPPRLTIAETRMSGLPDILERALATLPSDRYPDANAFAAALRAASAPMKRPIVLTAPLVRSARPLRSLRSRRIALGAVITVLGLAVLGAASALAIRWSDDAGTSSSSTVGGLAVGTPDAGAEASA
ncbi:MAG: serine/threonine-protein kinase, partial [Anaerolineaceae bacterium]